MKKIENNPYSSTTSATEQQGTGSCKSLGRLATLFTSTIIICSVAIITGETLAVIVLLPPMNGWFSMNGEFDGLILIGMPMWAAGYGFVTAIVFGATFPRKYAAAIAIAVCSVMVTWFCWSIATTANGPSDRYSALTISAILLAAITSGVAAACKGLTRINRIRARSSQDAEAQHKPQHWLRFVVITLTALWGLIDAAVLIMILQDSTSLWLTPLGLFGLIFGLGVMALCAYQSATGSELRTAARLCLSILIVGLVTTIYLWLKVVWFRSG